MRRDRIGKGAGYSDIEVALVHNAGLLRPDTLIATTVHPLQVLNKELPATDHDFQLDLIVTPYEVIAATRRVAAPDPLGRTAVALQERDSGSRLTR